MITRVACSLLMLLTFVLLPGAARAEPLQLHARFRIAPGDTQPQIITTNLLWEPAKTAIVVCDMWNQHWCQGATRRVAEMAPRMNEVIEAARKRGVFIIHCPSSTLQHYEGTAPRLRAQAAPRVAPKVPLQTWCRLDPSREAPLPIDDTDGGCDDVPQCPTGSPWTRQIDLIRIEAEDAITDSAEAYNLIQQRGIDNVLVMGVHVNMCVLGRPFSIRQMVYQGKNVLLMRDLTDAMYNSKRRPYVSHCRGTELVVEHIERFWCPTITSVDLIGGEPFRFQEDKRPNIVFLIGEQEYQTRETLPAFAQSELDFRGFNSQFIHADEKDPNAFPGLEAALKDANLLVLSVRRRTPTISALEAIRQYLAQGKPLVGIRTASHAFGAMPADAEHAAWVDFDREILGGHYEGHYSNKPPNDAPTIVSLPPNLPPHPILTGWPAEPVKFTSHLYKNREMANSTTTLLIGSLEGQDQREPVAWINTAQDHRVFYTSLGSPEDFQQAPFRRLFLNGIIWALNQTVPPADLPLQRLVAIPTAESK